MPKHCSHSYLESLTSFTVPSTEERCRRPWEMGGQALINCPTNATEIVVDRGRIRCHLWVSSNITTT